MRIDDLVVEQPITPLEQQLRQLFPAETINVAINADAIVLSGRVSSTEMMLRAAEVARRLGQPDLPGAQAIRADMRDRAGTAEAGRPRRETS